MAVEPSKTLKLPCSLTFDLTDHEREILRKQLEEGKALTVPSGASTRVDAKTNLVLYGGRIPTRTDPQKPVVNLVEPSAERPTARLVQFRMLNNRLFESASGNPRTFPSSRYVKAVGEAFEKARSVEEGDQVAISGYVATDQQQGKDRQTGADRTLYYDNFFVTDLAILEKRPADAPRIIPKKGTQVGAAKPPEVKV